MSWLRIVLVVLVVGIQASSVLAQGEFPGKAVSIVIPYPAGSIVDVRMRQIADVATRQSGWKFMMDNRPGAMGTIGATYVARAQPDGYTILAGSSSELNLVPAYGTKVEYDAQRDFVPITQTTQGLMVLVVPTSLGVNSVQELIALARKSSEPLSYGSAGPGSVTFVAGKLLEKKIGVSFIDVPYKSASQALLDLIPGRLHFQFDFVATSLPYVRDGKLKPLLVTSKRRVPLLPNVPTAAEAGIADLTIPTIAGFFAPRGTSDGVIQKLQQVLAAATRSPEMVKVFSDSGSDAIGGSSQEFKTVMSEDRTRWNAIIKVTGIHAE